MRTTHSDDTATVVDAINNELRAYLDSKNQQLGSISPHVADSINLLTQFATNGGKRIRPQFAWAAYSGLKNTTDVAKEDDAAALRAFTALELIQACALIHDDIIDSSDTRRGNPTVHKTVETNHQDTQLHGSSRAFGEAVAILVGDLALAWADDMLRDSGVSAEGLSRMYQPWQNMRSEVIAGQLLDICLEATRGEDERESEKVNRYKTAAYTIERPLHLGAALAGASEEATSRPTVVISVSLTSYATTCSAFLVILLSPANPLATTYAKANAPCCSPKHCRGQTNTILTPRRNCVQGSAPPPRRKTSPICPT